MPPHRDHYRVEGDRSGDRRIGRRDHVRIVSRRDSARKTGPEREHDMAGPASGHVMTRHARLSDRRVVVFIGGAKQGGAPDAKPRTVRDRRRSRRESRRKAAGPSHRFERREPRKRDRLRARVRHAAVRPRRSGQLGARSNALSLLAALCWSVGEDLKRNRWPARAVSLLENSPPSPSPARLLLGFAPSFARGYFSS
jgi:hypothetical protein